MLRWITERLIGTRNQRVVNRIAKRVEGINRFFEDFKGFKDEDFLKKTDEFLARLRDGEPADSMLEEAFGLVKARAYTLLGYQYQVRGLPMVWDMVPYDVQLIGGIVLFQGKIAEMKTGEGKTLVATLPLYLHGLLGRIRTERGEKNQGVHLVTVNDYLAARDREWMRIIYEGLGLSVGCIQSQMPPEIRKNEYAADIVYGTNNEFGFDYLRDHMAFTPEDRVQRGHYYAIVDEVDSILIDEARTPLIISGPAEHSRVEQYREMREVVDAMVREQNSLLARFLDEAERLLKEGKSADAGLRLLQVKRGSPKNKRLFKLLQEPGVMKLVDKSELAAMKDKGETMRRLDSELFFIIDEKMHTVDITEKGREFIAQRNPKYRDLFQLPDLATALPEIDRMKELTPQERFSMKEKLFAEYGYKTDRIHAVQQLLKAYMLFEREVEYVVMDGKIVIVDEFTGRLMPGRRWSDGLHEAVEAKEGVKVHEETQTLATITIQNYFRMYDVLAGMTGTAMTEAQEFWDIYKLDVVAIPTNKPVRRVDYPDKIFKTKKEKYQAVVEEIEKWHKRGRPILVGTTSIEESELVSRLLKLKGIPHQVLNARHHEREALIVAKAGQPGAVTIATNMAGRGTDIKLGPGVVRCPEDIDEACRGRTEVKECAINTKRPTPGETCPRNPKDCIRGFVPCGLLIIGTQKNESRRIDNQLRGRSGRQGDPGASKFFLSLEDDLLRLFGSDKVVDMMERWGKKEEEPVESRMVTKALENAQKRVEMQHFQIRKRLLEYDDVMNRQREVIYGLRDQILEGADMRETILEEYIPEFVYKKMSEHLSSENPKEEERRAFADEMSWAFLSDFSFLESIKEPQAMAEAAIERIKQLYEEREAVFGSQGMREAERITLLTVMDRAWRYHLYALDHLKEGMYLRQYAQKDPLVEYKKESFALFDELMDEIRTETLRRLFRLREVPKPIERRAPVGRAYKPELTAAGAAAMGEGAVRGERRGTVPRGVRIIEDETKGKK